MSRPLPPGYESELSRLFGLLVGHYHKWGFGRFPERLEASPIELYEHWTEWTGLELHPDLTWLMWSTAMEEAREACDLPRFERYPIALIGLMREGPFRAMVREVDDGFRAGIPVPVIVARIQRLFDATVAGET